MHNKYIRRYYTNLPTARQANMINPDRNRDIERSILQMGNGSREEDWQAMIPDRETISGWKMGATS